MKRSIIKSRLNDTEHRYRVLLESDECEVGTMESRQRQYDLLRAIVDNAGMMDCGPAIFQTMKMSHDGVRWIIEMEAVSA